MSSYRQRTFAAFGAILFLITSSALTIAVIYQSSQNSNSTPSSNKSSSTSQTSSQNLAGTKLSGFTATSSVPALEENDLVKGTGATVQPGQTVTVDYTGAVASTGIIFQSTKGAQPATLSLKEVIQGWAEGIPGMKVGGTRELLIPAALAYGANPPAGSNIPANANLVFDVTVDKID